MRKYVYTFLSFILVASPSITFAYTFNQNLRIGDSGQDVLELQKFLNTNPLTQISNRSQSGSRGFETYYFGEKTKQAVIAFQNLYAEQILVPNNLPYGTGFFGVSTRTFMNSIQPVGTLSTPTIPTFSSTPVVPTLDSQNSALFPNQFINSNSIPDFYILKNIVQAGDYIPAGSTSVLSDKLFYIDQIPLDIDCFDEHNCGLKIYKTTPAGKYTLSTSNLGWNSYPITVIGSDVARPEVKIDSLSLTKENIITGKNLSDKITIYTQFGVFKSETHNNSFVLEFPKDKIPEYPIKTSQGVFYIKNSNGLESETIFITYDK